MNSSVSPPLLVLILVFCGFIGVANSQEENKGEGPPKSPDPGRNSEGPSGGPWDSLDEEQKQKLREALRAVWTDPSVIHAREEVKVASESYQKAIRSAIGKADPSVANVLRELETLNKGRSEERLGGGPSIRMMPRRGGDYPMGPPGFLERLSEDQKNRFREAERAARESEAVSRVKADWEKLQGEEEALRRRKIETLRRMRAATLEEMVRIDPSLGEVRDKLMEFWKGDVGKRPNGPGPGPGPGSRERGAPIPPREP